MTKDEAVQKLATVGHLSMAHAEDLYDSFFETPVVPKYVADWIKKCKMFKSFAVSLSFALHPSVWEANSLSGECIEWLMDAENQETYARAWLDGYEIEKEARYTVRVKGIKRDKQWLVFSELTECWWFGTKEDSHYVVLEHTRKELEEADFGWVFDCPGVEVTEVTDE
ncbi:DUF1642 domain-containing protein [Streptococcus vestibularis]